MNLNLPCPLWSFRCMNGAPPRGVRPHREPHPNDDPCCDDQDHEVDETGADMVVRAGSGISFALQRVALSQNFATTECRCVMSAARAKNLSQVTRASGNQDACQAPRVVPDPFDRMVRFNLGWVGSRSSPRLVHRAREASRKERAALLVRPVPRGSRASPVAARGRGLERLPAVEAGVRAARSARREPDRWAAPVVLEERASMAVPAAQRRANPALAVRRAQAAVQRLAAVG
jgi:hypothetical protein